MYRPNIDRAKRMYVLSVFSGRRRQADPPKAEDLGRRMPGVLGHSRGPRPVTVHRPPRVTPRLGPGMSLALGVVLMLMAASLAPAQSVLYVDTDATGPVHDGSHWCSAYTFLQDALAHAEGSGGVVTEIHVADGVYKPDQGASQTPSDRWATFQLLNGVALRGGFAGCGAPLPNERDIVRFETILSGDLNGNDTEDPQTQSRHENSFHVTNGSKTDETAILDGFTITGSFGRKNHGGGMRNSRGAPTVIRCTFTRNIARHGGAILNYRSSPLLLNCIFRGNIAFNNAGAMYNVTYSLPSLVNCIFHGNVAFNGGGAMVNEAFSAPSLVNCLFGANLASTGAGMSNHRSAPILTNCTLVGNTAVWRGGGMSNIVRSAPTLSNCIVWGNRDSGGMDESAQLWNDDHTPVSTYVVNYSCIQGWTGQLGGVGNVGFDPRFLDPGHWDDNGTPDFLWDDVWVGGNHRLSPGSPCIDAGDNSAVSSSVTADLDGNLRFLGDPVTPDTGIGLRPIVDMGAYEYQPVLLDIMPKRCPNRVSFRSGRLLPIALLGTSAFDVTRIDLSSLMLTRADGAGGSVMPTTRGHGRRIAIDDLTAPFGGDLCGCQKLGADGIDDLVLPFSMRELAEVLELGSGRRRDPVTLTLRGTLFDGTPFQASDCILTTGP